MGRRWKNKRRKTSNKGEKKTVEIPTEDARPVAGDTEAPTRWCLGEKAT